VLLATRQRPTWASARRILYGEVHEAGRNALSFTLEEARAVLASSARIDAAGVIQLADGWPAVLGLAALSEDSDPPDLDLPKALYDYFADELYEKADESLRLALCKFSLVPRLTPALAKELVDPADEHILARASDLGFLTADHDSTWSLHPLLRSFLQLKLESEHGSIRQDIVAEVGNLLVSRGLWDAAFDLSTAYAAQSLFVRLVESALQALLAEGRQATLSAWLEHEIAKSCDAAVLELAQAELALRRADYRVAHTLAQQAARRLPTHHALKSAACMAAARAAHLDSRERSALRFSREAERSAVTESDRVQALWIQFVATTDLEHDGADEILKRLRATRESSANNDLRIAAANAILARERGQVQRSVHEALLAERLLARATDPMARSTFLSTLGYGLILSAQYDEAMRVSKRALEHAEDYHLSFVIPNAMVTTAGALLGLRQFARAHAVLDKIGRAAAAINDEFLWADERILRARVLLAQGRPVDATQTLALDPDLRLPRGLQAEYVGCRGLTLAAQGASAAALADASQASRLTSHIEGNVLSLCVRAIVAIHESEPARRTLTRESVALALRTGDLNDFVTGYRAYPGLLVQASEDESTRRHLQAILTRARDHALARQIALPIPRISRLHTLLTPREGEVHDLIAQGLSNREIADRLFISEVTVKVHARHIFEKLGVRSRTELAVRAALNYVDSGVTQPLQQEAAMSTDPELQA
jgi:ATP/maltotriose-dependent transcriptional regulator MalT